MELRAGRAFKNVRMPQLVLLDNIARLGLAVERGDTKFGGPAAELAR